MLNILLKINLIDFLIFITFLFSLVACAPQPPLPSSGHLDATAVISQDDNIPPITQVVPFVPPPQTLPILETFTVVVVDVPVNELLFALARDADFNLDIHPGITGKVTLSAIEQTLPQILERIADQVDLAYQIKNRHITVSLDRPYLELYKVNYVNMLRDTENEVTVATQIASTGSVEVGEDNKSSGSNLSGNNSKTKITNESRNRFWDRLKENIIHILESTQKLTDEDVKKDKEFDRNVIVNPESGTLVVQATRKQHQEIQHFIDTILASVQKQVLIEATIVEVELGDKYQAGVDWKRVAGDYSYSQSLLSGNLSSSPFYSIEYNNADGRIGDVFAKVRLLEQFGKVKVLSSPRIMALNNQTAVLKVVDNRIYFTVQVEVDRRELSTETTYETNVHTVPVGLIIMVTPQISENDVVMLNVRPTISRIIGFVNDPTPLLALSGVESKIPEIQVREMESVLRVQNGNIAVLGGLMQDTVDRSTDGIPLVSKIPVFGNLFSYRKDEYKKTELIIFLRPVVVKDASLSSDLHEYKTYLPDPSQNDIFPPTGILDENSNSENQ